MTHLRFFIDSEHFVVGDIVFLEGSEFHHIRSVIRIAEGEEVPLVNGRGGFARGVVESVERHRCCIRVVSSEHKEKPKARIVLGLSLLRPNHLDFAIEKGTEVGVDTFVLFPADKSEKKEFSSSMKRRLDALITAAMKQSGRSFRPEIQEAASLESAFVYLPTPRLFADLQENAVPLVKRLTDLPKESSVSLLIGPESGWSENERKLLRHEGPPVLLHSNVLRAETAAVVAIYTASLRIQELS